MLVAVTPGAVAPPLPLELLLPLLLVLALVLLLLDDDPQPAATSATVAITPTHASDLVPRKLIPLLLHMGEPPGTRTFHDARNVI
jgi:hypothetical protein